MTGVFVVTYVVNDPLPHSKLMVKVMSRMQKLMVVLLLQSDGEDAVDYAKVNGIDPR